MPYVYEGNTNRSPYVQLKDWERSPRNPLTHQLVLRSNRLNRLQTWCTWPSKAYGNNPRTALLSGLTTTGQYRLDSSYKFGQGAYARAFSKFREQAWGDAQASFAVDLAESKQSLRLIYESLSRALKFTLAFKRGRFGDALEALKSDNPLKTKGAPSMVEAGSQNWLAYRLGVTPMIGSIDSALQVIDDPLKYHFRFCKGTSALPFFKVLDHNNGPSYWHTVSCSGIYRVTIKAKVTVNDPSLARLNQFGLTNPLDVAWELLPFSFLIDRVVKVGDYLSSFDDFLGLSFSDLSITDSLQGSEEWTVSRPGWQPVGDVHLKALTHRKTRSLSSSIPVPSLQMGKGLFADAKKSADVAALLVMGLVGALAAEKKQKSERRFRTSRRWSSVNTNDV